MGIRRNPKGKAEQRRHARQVAQRAQRQEEKAEEIEDLTFSASPTQAEVEALQEKVAKALRGEV